MLWTHVFLNLYFSNIKLSSPSINNIIIAGSILIFSCVFITTMDYGHMLPESADNHICMVSQNNLVKGIFPNIENVQSEEEKLTNSNSRMG